MATLLLDSGLVIRHLRDEKQTIQLLRGLGRMERFAVASVTRLEVHAGMHLEERYKTQKLLSRFVIYDLDALVADRTGDLIRTLVSTNRTMSIPDAIIAATALTHRLTLLTFNRAHFAIVPGLSLYPFPSTN